MTTISVISSTRTFGNVVLL